MKQQRSKTPQQAEQNMPEHPAGRPGQAGGTLNPANPFRICGVKVHVAEADAFSGVPFNLQEHASRYDSAERQQASAQVKNSKAKDHYRMHK